MDLKTGCRDQPSYTATNADQALKTPVRKNGTAEASKETQGCHLGYEPIEYDSEVAVSCQTHHRRGMDKPRSNET